MFRANEGGFEMADCLVKINTTNNNSVVNKQVVKLNKNKASRKHIGAMRDRAACACAAARGLGADYLHCKINYVHAPHSHYIKDKLASSYSGNDIYELIYHLVHFYPVLTKIC